jgi:hypothetical protein
MTISNLAGVGYRRVGEYGPIGANYRREMRVRGRVRKEAIVFAYLARSRWAPVATNDYLAAPRLGLHLKHAKVTNLPIWVGSFADAPDYIAFQGSLSSSDWEGQMP